MANGAGERVSVCVKNTKNAIMIDALKRFYAGDCADG